MPDVKDRSALTALQNLRLQLMRQEGSSVQAGDAGEELTRRCLDVAGVSWLHVKQEKGGVAAALRDAGKRPDFLVGVDGTSLLLDAKCLRPFGDEDDALTFALAKDELERLNETGRVFGLHVALIIWSRKGSDHRFVVTLTDRFEDERVIGDDKTPALSATFRLNEITTLRAR